MTTALYIAAFFATAGAMYLGSRAFMSWRESKLVRPPEWERAVEILCKLYEIKRPRVFFVSDGSLTCADGKGFESGGCVGGTWAVGSVTVAWERGSRISAGALAHELVHEQRYQWTGAVWGDPHAHDGMFQELVTLGNDLLRAEGL